MEQRSSFTDAKDAYRRGYEDGAKWRQNGALVENLEATVMLVCGDFKEGTLFLDEFKRGAIDALRNERPHPPK